MRVVLSSVGCKLNQAELEALGRAFEAAGHEIVAAFEAADVHVVNSCTVTQEAARDSRRLARRGQGAHRRLHTVVTGCHATTQPGDVSGIPGVDLVVGNADKHRLVEFVEQSIRPATSRPPLRSQAPPRQRTRAAVKIQDGCSVRCAFCIVPAARGGEASRPPRDILDEVHRLAGAGAQEIVLTGVQISSYRSGGWELSDLVRAVLSAAPLRRLRLSSLAPWRIGEREIALWGDPRLCRHVHLSLQSGCAATLARMRRPITPAGFASAVARLRAAVAGLAVTTDVIVGFPGESDAGFAESLAFVAAMEFARVHVFPFSPRPGTPAAQLPGQVPAPIVATRVRAMRAAAAAGRRAFLKAQVGQRVEVLWERQRQGWWEGYTDTYVPVRARAPGARSNTLAWVEVEAVEGDHVRGCLSTRREGLEGDESPGV